MPVETPYRSTQSSHHQRFADIRLCNKASFLVVRGLEDQFYPAKYPPTNYEGDPSSPARTVETPYRSGHFQTKAIMPCKTKSGGSLLSGKMSSMEPNGPRAAVVYGPEHKKSSHHWQFSEKSLPQWYHSLLYQVRRIIFIR